MLLVDVERFALELVEGLLDALGDGLADFLLRKKEQSSRMNEVKTNQRQTLEDENNPTYGRLLLRPQIADKVVEVERLAPHDRDALLNARHVGRLVGQDGVQAVVVEGQHDGRDGRVCDQSAHAPLEAHEGLVHVDFALGEDVQPAAAVDLLQDLVHHRLVDARTTNYGQDLAQPEQDRVPWLAEADLFGAQCPAALVEPTEEVLEWQRGTYLTGHEAKRTLAPVTN